MATASLLRRAAIVALATSILAAAVPALAATTFTTTSITTDNFTANGTVSFSDADADTITIGQNGATPDTVTINGIGNLNLNNTGNNLTLASGGVSMNGDITLTDTQWGVTSVGAATFSGLLVQPLTASDDTLTFVLSGGASRFAGTITAADLTAARSWSFPDAGGNVVIDSATQTLSNKTLSGPRVSGSLLDSTGATVLSLTPVGAAVNAIDIASAQATFSPQIRATGTDANLDVLLVPKGTGVVRASGVEVATVSGTQSLSNKTLTTPTIAGGTVNDLTALSLAQSGFRLILAPTGTVTGNRTLAIDLQDGNRTLQLNDNLIKAGTGSLTLSTTAATTVILPNSGTLATIAGAEALSNKTLASPKISTAIFDTNGNELVDFGVVGSAVNQLLVNNAATTGNPLLGVNGDDANIGLTLQTKGTGDLDIQTNTATTDVIRFRPATGAARFTGTITSSDLTANRVWTLPNVSGTLALLTDVTGASGWSDGGANVALVTTNDQVGIGTTAATAKLDVVPHSNALVGLLVKGAASQSADLVQMRDDAGTVLARFTSNGDLRLRGNNVTAVIETDATTTVDLFNGVPTTVNFAGAAAALNIGASTGTTLVRNDLATNGTTLTLDADNASTGATVQIIANQGSEIDGIIRYNATTNAWELSNDGGAFAAIASGSSLSGTGSAGQVAFFNGATSVTGESQLFWDGTNKRLGVGTNGQTSTLYVQPAANAGNTGLNTGWFQVASGTYTDNVTAASGTAATFAFNAFHQPTLAASNAAVSTTNAATVYIAGAPANGSNMSILNSWALWAASGKARFDGDLYANGNVTLGDGSGDTLNLNAGTVTLAASVNVDSDTLVIDPSANRIGLGTASPETRLHVSDGIAPNAALIAGGEQIMVSSSNAQAIQRFITAGNVDQHQTIIRAVRARGTLDTPTAPALNDRVLSLQGMVYDSGAPLITAEMRFSVDGAASAGVAPQRIGLFTSATDFAGLTERLTVLSGGNVGIGDTSPAALLTVGASDAFQVGSNGNVSTTGSVSIGTGGSAITLHKTITAVSLDIPAAGANQCTFLTQDVGAANAGVGDIVLVAPMADDPAWDNGTLSAYVETGSTVKIVFCADGDGGDPAAMNYRIDTWRH